MERRNLYDFAQSPIYLWTEFISRSISMQEMGAKVAGECWDYGGVLWPQRLTALWKQEDQGEPAVMPSGSTRALWSWCWHPGPRVPCEREKRRGLWQLIQGTFTWTHIHRGPGKLTHLSLSESGTEDQKKDTCLLVTKRIIWSICAIPLESCGTGVRVGDMILAESSKSWWKPQVFNITVMPLFYGL